jgi:hypothetical protein
MKKQRRSSSKGASQHARSEKEQSHKVAVSLLVAVTCLAPMTLKERHMLKQLLATALVLPTFANAAGGVFDGIYQCNLSALGQTATFYSTVNGQPDGRAVIAIVALHSAQDISGYAIGQITGTTFNGTTDKGLPFNAAINGNTITGTLSLVVSDVVVSGALACVKVW